MSILLSLRLGARLCMQAQRHTPLTNRSIAFPVLHALHARTSVTSPDPGDTPVLSEDFFTKQKRLKRPLSPFVSIYKPQITWTMSIAFRCTEVFMISTLATFSIYLYTMDYTSFDKLLTALRDLQIPPAVLTAAKLAWGIPFGYFVWGGLRHIAWDRGFGFSLPTLYKSAYVTIFLSLLTGLGVAFFRF